jgi:hypothetical protein
MNVSSLRLPGAASIEASLADDSRSGFGRRRLVPALARALLGFDFSRARLDEDLLMLCPVMDSTGKDALFGLRL